MPGITWLTRPKHKKEALTHMVYGNEASPSTKYSCAAIIAVIPPFQKRGVETASERARASPAPVSEPDQGQ